MLVYPWPGRLCCTYPSLGRPLAGVLWVGPRGGCVAGGVSIRSCPHCCSYGLCCPVPSRPCSYPGPCVPLEREVAVFGSRRSILAWFVVCGVHPPASNSVYAGTCPPRSGVMSDLFFLWCIWVILAASHRHVICIIRRVIYICVISLLATPELQYTVEMIRRS